MIDVNGHVNRLALRLQRMHEVGRDAFGRGHRHAGVDANDLDVFDGRKRRHYRAQAARRQHQRIAAGKDHLPDRRIVADVIEGAIERRAAKRFGFVGPDPLAAETEAAIDSADMRELQQHAVGIPMHDALNRAVGVVADWVGAFFGPLIEFGGVRHELACDGVVWIDDQIGERWRQRHGIARGNRVEVRASLGRHQTGIRQLRRRAKRFAHEFLQNQNSATGAQIT